MTTREKILSLIVMLLMLGGNIYVYQKWDHASKEAETYDVIVDVLMDLHGIEEISTSIDPSFVRVTYYNGTSIKVGFNDVDPNTVEG